MKWTRSVVPSLAAVAALVAFLPKTGPTTLVRARDFAFSPAPLVVAVGETVRVRNDGSHTHTFTCEQCDVDSGNVQPGQEKVVRFPRAGTFDYSCIYHREQGMKVRVTVGAAPAAVPAQGDA